MNPPAEEHAVRREELPLQGGQALAAGVLAAHPRERKAGAAAS